MPVVLWNLVQDPLDVDKKKNQKDLQRETHDHLPVADTKNENSFSPNDQEESKSNQLARDHNRQKLNDDQIQQNEMQNYDADQIDAQNEEIVSKQQWNPASRKLSLPQQFGRKVQEEKGGLIDQDLGKKQNNTGYIPLNQLKTHGTDASQDNFELAQLKKKFDIQQREARQMLHEKFNTGLPLDQDSFEESSSPKRPQFPLKIDRDDLVSNNLSSPGVRSIGGRSIGGRSTGGGKKIGGFARRQQQRQTSRELAGIKIRFGSNGSGSRDNKSRLSNSSPIRQQKDLQNKTMYTAHDYQDHSIQHQNLGQSTVFSLQSIINNQNEVQNQLKSQFLAANTNQYINFQDTALPNITRTATVTKKVSSLTRNTTKQISSSAQEKLEINKFQRMQTVALPIVDEEHDARSNIIQFSYQKQEAIEKNTNLQSMNVVANTSQNRVTDEQDSERPDQFSGASQELKSTQIHSKQLVDTSKQVPVPQDVENPSAITVEKELGAMIIQFPQNIMENQRDLNTTDQKMKIRRSKQSYQTKVQQSKELYKSQEDTKSVEHESQHPAPASNSVNRASQVIRQLKETQAEKERQMEREYEQRRQQMQKNFEREQQNQFIEKQNQILKNLEQIAELERELEIARLYKQEQEKKNAMKDTIGIQTSKTLKMVDTPASNDKVLNIRNSIVQTPKVQTQPISRLSNVQTNTGEIVDRPQKKGMVNNSQQINALGLQTNDSASNEKIPSYKDQANDPQKRDQGVDAKARDVSTDPMVGEKSTDPKVQDIATDAWKRDGLQQTSVQSYRQSTEKLGTGPIIAIDQQDIQKNVTSGGTQYNIEQAINPNAESEKDEAIDKEENTLIDTVNGIFDEYDDDRSGSLNQEETCRLLDVILKNQGLPPVTIKSFNKFFKEYDINGDGVLSKGEMAIFIQQFLDTPVNDEQESSVKETETDNKKPNSAQKELALQNAIEKLEEDAEIQKELEAKKQKEYEAEKQKQKEIEAEKQKEIEQAKQKEAEKAKQEEVIAQEGSQSAKETKNRANLQSLDSKIENANVRSEKLEGEDIIEATKPVDSLKQNDKTSPLSMFIENDSQKESQIDNSPIYHDHLLDEVMNQGSFRQEQLSNDQQRNESRSTQQMFEHQFGARGKDKFKNSKWNSNAPNKGNLTIINQSINQGLPPINQENTEMNGRHAYQKNSDFQFRTMRQDSHYSPQVNSQANNFDHFRTPKPFYGQGQSLTQGQYIINQQQQSMKYQPNAEQLTNIDQRQRRNQARMNNQFQSYNNNGQIQFQNNMLYSDASLDRIDPSAQINIMSNATNSVSNLQPANFHNFGNRNQSLPPVFHHNQAIQNQNSVQSSFGQQNQYHSNQRSAAPIQIRDHDAAINQNQSMLQHLKNEQRQQNLPAIHDMQRPSGEITHKMVENNKRGDRNRNPLNQFKGQELEMYYAEKVLKPEVEKEIKRGFFEIRKKFASDDKAVQTARGGKLMLNDENEEEVQVYVSHICLHNFHPIFSKLDMETVKTMLQFGSIVYLKKGQVLYAPGFNENLFYIVLFGRFKLVDQKSQKKIGQNMNLGWTIGEEILFKVDTETQIQKQARKKVQRKEICKATIDSCVIGIEKKGLSLIKKSLASQEEFAKIEIVLRGNHLVKKNWK